MEKIQRREDLAWTKMNDELVILDLGLTRYVHQLNSVASFLWDELDRERTIDELSKRVCLEFSVEQDIAKEDILEISQQFKKFGLLA